MRIFSTSSVFAAIAALALAACGDPPPKAPPPRSVIAQVTTAQPASGAAVYSGEVRARYENDLAFRVAGKVIARQVEVGATVKQGQVLARLDPHDAQLAIDSARSQLAAAEADHALARADFERYRDLYAKKFVSQAVIEARETTFATARARLAQAKAQLATAQNQSAYTALVAEANGVITAVNLEPGQVVAAGQAVMRFARTDEREVAIAVPERRLAELRDAREIAVSLWAAPGKHYRGRIREIAPHADPATRTFAVRISVFDADANVALGMTAAVALGGEAHGEVIALPLTALTEVDGKPAVWIVDPRTHTVNLRPVDVIAYREDGVVVRDGVRAGEVVVTAGAHKLIPGETVRAISETLASPQSQRLLDAAIGNGG
jgi:multidrug efflux system membrane fusion protein